MITIGKVLRPGAVLWAWLLIWLLVSVMLTLGAGPNE